MADRAPLDDAQDEGGSVVGLLYAIQECVRSAVASMRAHGLRSLLTMLGIIIGVASVICVIALVQGLTTSITAQFQGLGSSMLTVRAYTPLEDQLRGQFNRLRATDMDEIRARIDGISHITPMIQIGGNTITHGSETSTGQIYGSTENLQDVQRLFPNSGRFISPSDDDSRRRVVVIGEKIRKDLRMSERPEGEFVQIGTEWFKVIGVMEARGEMFGVNLDQFSVIPYQTALAMTNGQIRPDYSITFVVDDPDSIANVKERVAALVRRTHAIGKDAKDDFVVEASDSIMKTFSQIMTTVTFVVSGVVGISLLVGGIGIMNIMLVSVTERTREIGIAKALGAPRRFILMQFLIEAMVLAVVGGIIGIGVGFALAYAAASAIPNFPAPSVPWYVILGACGFSALVGVIFGILPASKAANLTPIDALRYE